MAKEHTCTKSSLLEVVSISKLRSFRILSCKTAACIPVNAPARLYKLCSLSIAITCPDSSSCMVSPTPPILWTLSLSSSSSSSCCLGIYIKSMQTCELHMATLEVYITIDITCLGNLSLISVRYFYLYSLL